MMKLTLVVLVLSVISTSYLQEVPNTLPDQPPLTNDPTSPLWSLQNYQVQRRKGKPCPRRSNRGDEPWIPSYSSKITHPLNNPIMLQPQALKNDDQNSQVTKDDNIPDETWRSYDATAYPIQSYNPNDLDDDCVEQLGATKGDAEDTALKIIEDCLRKKQKNKVELTLLGSGRRSMPVEEDNEDTEGGPLFGTLGDPSQVPLAGRQGILMDDGDTRRKSNTKAESESSAKTAPPLGQAPSSGYGRICYACSTATNPSCWNPDQSTTIKYCTQEKSCVTKTFGNKNSLTLIRDCANSCKDTSIPGLEPKYKSCKLCHNDYCNSAISINGYNLAIILFVAIVKCTNLFQPMT